MSIFILEGLDKTGKTTLAKKLCKKFSAKLIKCSQPGKFPFIEYVKIIEQLDLNKNYVFDRFYLGERAYGPVYRKNDLKDEEQFYLELLLLKHEPTLIYCWQYPERSRELFVKCGETFTKEADIERLRFLFENAVYKSILSKNYYNFRMKNEDELLSQLRSKKKKLVVNIDYLGVGNPEFLIVGDEINKNLSLKQATMSPFCSSSGLFLMKALLTYKKFIFNKMMILNSMNNKKILNINSLDLSKTYKIVCLGRKSYLRVKDKFENVVSIPHPQFAKRFGGENALEKYIITIKGALNELLF